MRTIKQLLRSFFDRKHSYLSFGINLNIKFGIIFTVFMTLSFISCESSIYEDEFLLDKENILDNQKTTLKNTNTETKTCVVDLIAGKDKVVGTVTATINTNSDYLNIIYQLNENKPWRLCAIHFDIQTDPENFPTNPKGNPIIGHFAYRIKIENAISHSEMIDLNSIPELYECDTLWIAAHAEIEMIPGAIDLLNANKKKNPFYKGENFDDHNTKKNKESAWAAGIPFNTNKHSMYFYCKSPCWVCGDLLYDERDGKVYRTVKIGEQCWMAENLATTKFTDGSEIPIVLDSIEWSQTLTPAYCWCLNDEETYGFYGALYNYYALETGKLPPTGWHVPNDADWEQLAEFISDSLGPCEKVDDDWYSVGNIIKSTYGWDLDGNGTNDVGFTALPGGYRGSLDGYFNNVGFGTRIWSSEERDADNVYYRGLLSWGNKLYRDYRNKRNGFYVRCVKD